MSRNVIKQKIRNSHNKALKEQKQFHLYKDLVPVFIKEKLPTGFNIRKAMSTLERMVPSHLFYDVDVIIVGQFDEFEQRQVNAMYQNGAIYLTNEQESESDMIDDIIHELAHSIIEGNSELIFGDTFLEREFLGKRKRMLDILEQEGYNISAHDFLDSSFSLEFDQFLFSEVGYPALTMLIMGLFVSPYGSTSLGEYFANGFEKYLMNYDNKKYIQKISPVLHGKIEQIIEVE